MTFSFINDGKYNITFIFKRITLMVPILIFIIKIYKVQLYRMNDSIAGI